MMRRKDTAKVGDQAEQEAARLLEKLGWSVTNLNESKKNFPTYDLEARAVDSEIKVSVKAARAKRVLRLGSPKSLRRLSDDAYIIAFLPSERGKELDIENQNYELWVIPGSARHEAIMVHEHYHRANPEKGELLGASIMLKDKVDKVGGRSISGAVFKKWREAYKDAWHLLPMVDRGEIV